MVLRKLFEMDLQQPESVTSCAVILHYHLSVINVHHVRVHRLRDYYQVNPKCIIMYIVVHIFKLISMKNNN